MNKGRNYCVFSLGLALAACGGGGVKSTPAPTPTPTPAPTPTPTPAPTPTPTPAPTPTPTPAPTPTPTPTPAPTPTPTPAPTPTPTPAPTPTPTNSSLDPLTVSQVFGVTRARLSGVASAGAVSSITAENNDFAGGVTLAYDASTGGYTVTDGSANQSFMPINKSATDSNAVISVYKVTGTGGRTDQLVLFNPGSGNTSLALTYVSYGAWQTVSGTSSVSFDQRYFVYGIRQGANQPSTGSASYVTKVDGFWATGTGLYALGGSATFNANFSNLTVATNLTLTGTNIENSSTKSLGLFNGTGSIASLGGAFNGTFVHQGADADGNVYSGAFNGAFFGPTGSEVGYTFRLSGANGSAVGAVVGKAQ